MSKEKQENHDFTAYDYMSVDPTESSLKSLTKIHCFLHQWSDSNRINLLFPAVTSFKQDDVYVC